MTPEVLLRLTLLRFDKCRRCSRVSDPPGNTQRLTQPTFVSVNGFGDTFLTLWVEQLARRFAVDASPRNVLLFLLPSQWSGAACDNYYLREDTDEQVDLQYLKGHCPTEQFLSPKNAAQTPFFHILDQLIVLFRPKLPQQLMTLQEWMASLDTILLSLRTIFVDLHSAFLDSFCEADKLLSASHHNLTWESTRERYCTTVCELCHLLDAQLITIVTRTVALQLNGACGSVRTSLFTTTSTESPEEQSSAVASLVSKRLDSIGAYVAATTAFGNTYPNEAQRIRLSSTDTAMNVDQVRGAFCRYVEKLNASTTEENEANADVLTGSLSAQLKAEKTRGLLLSGLPSADIMAVSPDQARSLIEPPDGGNLVSRVAAIAPADDDTLKTVEQLLADQQHGEARRCSGQPAALTPPDCLTGRKLSSTSTKACRQEGTEKMAAISPSASPKKPRSSHREAWLFWTRLQHKLGREDVVIQRVSEQCSFDNESPYPGVFLVDLDARNNDRATMSFVNEVQELIPADTSTAMSDKSVSLFKDACASYAKEVLNKSKELQSTLPFLPMRTEDVLLGSLYAVLRADKQFQSLKQIYQQTSQLSTESQRRTSDKALLANVRTLIMKRIHFFSKAAVDDDSSSHEHGSATESTSKSSRETRLDSLRSDGACRAAVSTAFDAVNQPHRASLLCSPRRRSSSTSATQLRSQAEQAKQWPSAMEALPEARRSIAPDDMPLPPPETRIEEVYRLACRFYGVNANSALMRQLKQAKENYITTLDLSSNYVGIKGLKPVLALLRFNSCHLISLSLCNNNIENEEIHEICRILEDQAGENLVHLDLSFNPISSPASSSLQELCQQLPHLESLMLKATLLSPEVAQELQRTLESKTAQRCD